MPALYGLYACFLWSIHMHCTEKMDGVNDCFVNEKKVLICDEYVHTL